MLFFVQGFTTPTQDPLAENYYSSSPYAYVRNNPLLRIDPTGKWDVTVHVYNNRAVYGLGYLNVTNKTGEIVFSTIVRVEGSNSTENNYNKRDRKRTYADTPTGTYKIKGWSKRLPMANRAAYGPNDVLELDYQEGEAAGKRNGIHLHGGRQEGKGGKHMRYLLSVTQGCIRIYDEDIAKMKTITDALEMNDSEEEEEGNLFKVISDLEKNKTELYPQLYTIPSSSDNNKENKKDEGVQPWWSPRRMNFYKKYGF